MKNTYVIATSKDFELQTVWNESDDCLVKMILLNKNDLSKIEFNNEIETAYYLIENDINLVDEVNYFFSEVVNEILN